MEDLTRHIVILSIYIVHAYLNRMLFHRYKTLFTLGRTAPASGRRLDLNVFGGLRRRLLPQCPPNQKHRGTNHHGEQPDEGQHHE